MTTMVGFSITASCITRAAKQVIVMLLPLPLGVPDDAALVRTTRARGGDHLIDRGTHGMELVIASDLLDQGAVILEQDEEAQVVEQDGRGQQAAHQRFQFVELAERVERHPVDGAPLHEAFAIG